MNFLNQMRKPKLSDIELIAIDLTSEYMSIDSEYKIAPDKGYCASQADTNGNFVL